MIVCSRVARPAVLAVTAVVGALLLGGCTPTAASRSRSASTPATTTPVVSPAAGTATQDKAAGTATQDAAVAGTTTIVTRVIDGDTFEVTGKVKIRVLGIDSCESNTPGGTRATDAAQAAILGQPVRLTAPSGVDLDRYGRELRYVSYSGGDFAEMMVRADHTAVYTKGHNDASSAVQARLRSLDTNGRTCGDPVSTTSSTATRAPAAVGTPKPSPRPQPRSVVAAPAPAPKSAGSYANCTAARAAGVTPLHRGEPGYSAKLDRDSDGIACE